MLIWHLILAKIHVFVGNLWATSPESITPCLLLLPKSTLSAKANTLCNNGV